MIGGALNNIEIGARLKSTRQAAHLSQEAFAAELSTALRTYQNDERGEREVSALFILALHDSFHIDPIWLLTGVSGHTAKNIGKAAKLIEDALGILKNDLL